MVRAMIPDLDLRRRDLAVALVSFPDQIRGFGHVKERNVKTALAARDEALGRCEERSPPLDSERKSTNDHGDRGGGRDGSQQCCDKSRCRERDRSPVGLTSKGVTIRDEHDENREVDNRREELSAMQQVNKGGDGIKNGGDQPGTPLATSKATCHHHHSNPRECRGRRRTLGNTEGENVEQIGEPTRRRRNDGRGDVE